MYLRQGVEKAFNLETKSATGLFQKAVELDQENPLGYSFLALTHMFAYEMSFDPKERAESRSPCSRTSTRRSPGAEKDR